jgi:hypothetical protein
MKRFVRPLAMKVVVSAGLFVSLAHGSQANEKDVWTQHNDNLRTGHYTAETVLTPALVQSDNFQRLPDLNLADLGDAGDQIYAQPLYIHELEFSPGRLLRNVLVVATQGNWIYAFDVDARASGASMKGSLIWKINLGYPYQVSDGNVIWPQVGITSTPVIHAYPVDTQAYHW